jgi:hypothetical protein
MSFKPERGKYFYLMAQHSRKVLGATRGQTGALLEQQTQGDEMQYLQQFEFHGGESREFFIKPRGLDLYLDIMGNSQDNGAALSLCTWHGNVANERFQFIPGGNGYYYLKAMHSGKVLDVNAYSTEDGAKVQQWSQNPHGSGPNQLFRPVPVEAQPSGTSSMDVHPFIADETSNRLKDLVAGIAGSVPEVGSALKGLVSFLWPAGQSTIFEQMRSYVEALMKELIAQERVIDLDKRLNGIYNNLNDYQAAAPGKQKGQWFTTVLGNLNDAEPYFLDTRNPEKTLPYFVALGTVTLTMLREQVLFYPEIFQEADAKRAEHLTKFREKLKKYLAASRLSRAKAMEWRLGKLRVDHSESTTFGIAGPSTTHTYTAKDTLTGWGASHQYNTLTGGERNAEALANGDLAARRTFVESQFGIELDAFLTPSYLWKYLDPEEKEKPSRQKVVFKTGPYAGHAHKPFNDGGKGPITRIKVHAGDRLDGVELFYGGVSGGLHGKVGGAMHCDVTLEPGEAIVGAYGSHGEVMHSLYFETNRGRVIGAGKHSVHSWTADPPESVEPTLTHISGHAGSGHIDGLSMHWEYWREE